MSDNATISFLGFNNSELVIMKTLLKIVQKLRMDFSILEPDQYHNASIVFVNADNAQGINEAEELSKANGTQKIMVGNQDYPNEVSIRKPMVLKRITAALQLLLDKQPISTRTSSNKPDVGKVLVVDDSFPVRTYMGQQLEAIAHGRLSVEFAESGEDALRILMKQDFHAVFLDVVMPGVDGYKICKWIKSNKPHISVTMLTSKKSPFDKVRGSMSGCDFYLVKPAEQKKIKDVLTKTFPMLLEG